MTATFIVEILGALSNWKRYGAGTPLLPTSRTIRTKRTLYVAFLFLAVRQSALILFHIEFNYGLQTSLVKHLKIYLYWLGIRAYIFVLLFKLKKCVCVFIRIYMIFYIYTPLCIPCVFKEAKILATSWSCLAWRRLKFFLFILCPGTDVCRGFALPFFPSASSHFPPRSQHSFNAADTLAWGVKFLFLSTGGIVSPTPPTLTPLPSLVLC